MNVQRARICGRPAQKAVMAAFKRRFVSHFDLVRSTCVQVAVAFWVFTEYYLGKGDVGGREKAEVVF